MKELLKNSVHDFLNKLGSDSMSPGGGAAGGLAASLGMALLEMTARINAKRKPGKTPISKIENLRKKVEALIDKDAEAFEAIFKAYREDKKSAKFQKALKQGALVPFEIAQITLKGLELGCVEAGNTSRWLASDLMESAILLEAAYFSARLNVEINLKEIQDKKFIVTHRRKLDFLERTIKKNKRKIFDELKTK